MAQSRSVDFNALPRATRERLLSCLAGAAAPQPILADAPFQRGALVGWIIVGLSGVGVAALAALPRFGRAVQGSFAIAGYALGMALIILGALGALRRRRLQAALPFKAGRYLFPTELIDARDRTLRLLPMRALVDFRGVHQHDNGVYRGTILSFTFADGAQETFTVHGKDLAEQALCRLRDTQASIQRAAQGNDRSTLRALDPFFEARMADGLASEAPAAEDAGPLARSSGSLFRRSSMFALSLGLGVVLSFPLFHLRNLVSDEAMFQDAVRHGSELAFEAYLTSGKRHAEEVRASLLPRAALREARRQGSVTALRAFLRRYPGSCVEDDAHAAIHALFEKTLGDFRDQASGADSKLLPFMERLVAYLEEHEDSRVEARFHSPSSAALSVVDALLKRRAASAGMGSIIPVGPHFDDAHALPRETSIINGLSSGFAAIFPVDIMKVDAGQRIVGEPEEPAAALLSKAAPRPPSQNRGGRPAPAPPALARPRPEIKVPTMEVRYKVGWAGDIYSEEKGDRQFVGIVVYFDVSMRIPGQAESYDFSLVVAPPDHFSVDYFSTGEPHLGGNTPDPSAGPPEGRVYDVMAERAFDQLTSKLRSIFFQPGSPAFEGRAGDDPDDGPRPRVLSAPARSPKEPRQRRGTQL